MYMCRAGPPFTGNRYRLMSSMRVSLDALRVGDISPHRNVMVICCACVFGLGFMSASEQAQQKSIMQIGI